MERRRILRALGSTLGLAGAAGCLSSGSGGTDPATSTDTTTDPGTTTDPYTTTDPGTPSRPETTSDPGATTDDPGDYPASDQPDPDLPVRAENHDDADQAVELAVSRGATMVHEATYDLAPGADRAVYNLREADPDGVERFTVGAAVGDQSDTVEVETSGCYGHVIVAVQEGGELFLTYSIC